MGIDIHGWVEIRPPRLDEWDAVVHAGMLLDRKYDAFNCLFGVTNYVNFIPIAAGRGIPEDASEIMRSEFAEDEKWARGPSWVNWAELAAIDWDEEAPHPDGCLHRYVLDIRGWVYEGKSASDRAMISHPEISKILRSFGSGPGSRWIWPDGAKWRIGLTEYRAEKLKRRDAMGNDWWTLSAIMQSLANRYGDTSVRLVVWFS